MTEKTYELTLEECKNAEPYLPKLKSGEKFTIVIITKKEFEFSF